jgi:hypothetical protein
MTTNLKTRIKIADEVWIATALLHREQPDRADFMIDEIVDRARREVEEYALRDGIYQSIIQHCVANRAPSPARDRMLFETAPGHRRLFRSGDPYHPGREGKKSVPARDEIPAQYADLLDWYEQWNRENAEDRVKNDPLLALYGSGKDLWADEHADEYIRRLREGWE